jgi:hypothetical protein
MDIETGIKYVGFFSFKKKINGLNLPLIRMVCWEDTYEAARENILSRIVDSNKPEDYYVAKYDVSGDIMIKLDEQKI